MGKIIRNGVTYGGNSTIAGNVSYNNQTSGLNSVTVQNAITELKSLFDNSEHIRMKVVDTLPAISVAEDNVIYLIDEDHNDIYEMYIVAEVDNVRQYISIGETDIDLSDYIMHVVSLPAPSAAELGNVYMYTGESTANYEHGYVYECVSDGATPPTYSWQEVTMPSVPHFIGTTTEWDALTSAEKAEYESGDIVFTDDNSGMGIIEQTIVDTTNAIASTAIYNLVQNIGTVLNVPVYSSPDNDYYRGRIKKDGEMAFRYRRLLWIGPSSGGQSDNPLISNDVGYASYKMESFGGLPKKVMDMIENSTDPETPMRHIMSVYGAQLPTQEVPTINARVDIVSITRSSDTFVDSDTGITYHYPQLNLLINPPVTNPTSSTGYVGPYVVDIVFNNFQA